MSIKTRLGLFSVVVVLLSGCTTTPWQQTKLSLSSYGNEAFDYKLMPTNILRTANMDAPTPLTINGAKNVTTIQLRDMMLLTTPPILVDVIGATQNATLPGAKWRPADGRGTPAARTSLSNDLAQLTGGDKSKPVVFFCLSEICWLSHNATVEAVALGYKNVYWYRGGRASWTAAGLEILPILP